MLNNNMVASRSADHWTNNMFQPVQSILPYANFTVFNTMYTFIRDGCATCNSSGGFITTAYQGDPPMGRLVDFFESCSDCIGDEKCPGCMQPLSLSFDLSAFESKIAIIRMPYYSLSSVDYEDALSAMPFYGFMCLCCGWSYDPDRHNDNEPDYEPDYDDDYLDDWTANYPS